MTSHQFWWYQTARTHWR